MVLVLKASMISPFLISLKSLMDTPHSKPAFTSFASFFSPPPPSFSRFAKAGKGANLTMSYSEKATKEAEGLMLEFFGEFNK